jgi:hypothetical protein
VEGIIARVPIKMDVSGLSNMAKPLSRLPGEEVVPPQKVLLLFRLQDRKGIQGKKIQSSHNSGIKI